MELSRSFRLQGGVDSGARPQLLSSHRRSNSSLLLSESITTEYAAVVAYERLSESMRLSSSRDTRCVCHFERTNYKKSSSRALTLLGKIFSVRKTEGCRNRQPEIGVIPAEKKAKKWSSWLPDPECRWPVQGW
ncbi:hypothetical protein CDL15_Pgr005155 [Punica granatum]|uniref:Uncharacterized protein n=1 Tax=Punica granatum TaxID=22663 RepID=A0A218WP39_PUNGR|nr:hypothetical protein CDL15_Pgr005155 [Punica granatum]PKI44685.1 hypothetical protein CRG98_034928 [Punica granatum]